MLGYLADAKAGVRGAVWYQGESDTGEKDRALYKQRFASFVADLRRETNRPELPVITVQLNRLVLSELGTPAHADWEAMREIQRQLSHELENVHILSIFDAGLSDGIHNDSLGNLRIAQRAAATALGAVHGHPIHWRHPECVAARQITPTEIELQFENVDGRLHYESRMMREFPFAVRDGQGEVPVTGYTLPARERFRITLGRPLAGPATVTGAPTANPPACVPFDIPGYRPLLGFTLPVTEG
jgi:sialate O-acetylesterase